MKRIVPLAPVAAVPTLLLAETGDYR